MQRMAKRYQKGAVDDSDEGSFFNDEPSDNDDEDSNGDPSFSHGSARSEQEENGYGDDGDEYSDGISENEDINNNNNVIGVDENSSSSAPDDDEEDPNENKTDDESNISKSDEEQTMGNAFKDESQVPESYPEENASYNHSTATFHRMAVLFFFVLGAGIGFFVVFGVGQKRRRNDNRVQQEKQQQQQFLPTPTAAPQGVPPPTIPKDDVFVEAPSPPTVQPTTVPTLSPSSPPLRTATKQLALTVPGVSEQVEPWSDDKVQYWERATSNFVLDTWNQNGVSNIEVSTKLLRQTSSLETTSTRRLLESNERMHSAMTTRHLQIDAKFVLVIEYSLSVSYLPPLPGNIWNESNNNTVYETEDDAAVLFALREYTFNYTEQVLVEVIGNATIVNTEGISVAIEIEDADDDNSKTTAPDSNATNTFSPTSAPSLTPRTKRPTANPLDSTTSSPTSHPPTNPPTNAPTAIVETPRPTMRPSAQPTRRPTLAPVATPPTSDGPSIVYGLQPDCQVQDTTRFNICLDLSSESGEVEDWFPLVVRAKERWERIIANDPWGPWPINYYSTLSLEYVATERPSFVVDDMYLAVIVGPIDGNGGRFAEAGPDRLLAPNRIVAASIRIDPADIDTAMEEGIFEGLMLHEIGHVMGLGPLWDEGVHIEGSNYIGTNAAQAWADLGCSGPLPLNSVKDNSHFNDNCLNTEVMTHKLRYGDDLHVSSITMGALEDLGYSVNREEEDSYSLKDLGTCGSACPEAGGGRRRMFEGATLDFPAPPVLRGSASKSSREIDPSMLQAAADRFRARSESESESDFEDVNFVSFVYQEDGHFESRVVRKHEVLHLW